MIDPTVKPGIDKGKSDPVDAVAAARAALSGTATGSAKSRDGNVEAIRVLMIARRSAVDTRIETLNQLRHLVFTASPEIRAKFTGLTAISLANKASGLRPRTGDDRVRYTTLVTIRALGTTYGRKPNDSTRYSALRYMRAPLSSLPCSESGSTLPPNCW